MCVEIRVILLLTWEGELVRFHLSPQNLLYYSVYAMETLLLVPAC